MDHDSALARENTPDCQTTVFSLPELRASIVPFLTTADIRAMIQTCSAWLDLWAPELYTYLSLSPSTSLPTPTIVKYGRYVQTLRVYKARFEPIMFFIQHTPNLLRFELSYASLSSAEVDQVLSALPAKVHHLYAKPVSLDQVRMGRMSWFPQPMFHSVGRLQNLQSLEWSASGMTIHVDEILHVLKACPHLVSLVLRDLKIVYLCSGSTIESESFAWSDRPSDPPGPLASAILETDLIGLYIGRRIQKLELHGVHISDEGVLRLLGIDMIPKEEEETTNGPSLRRSHALMHLVVDHCFSFTHRSGSRVLQECDRIQHLDLSESMVATIELFRVGGEGGQRLWSCSKSIQQLSLDIKPSNFNPREIYRREALLRHGVPPLALADQLLIRDQFRALIGLRVFHLKGYPIDLVVMEDMAFAKNLQVAEAQIMCRVPFESVDQELERLMRLAKDWVVGQPQGWHATVGKGTINYPPKFLIKFLAKA